MENPRDLMVLSYGTRAAVELSSREPPRRSATAFNAADAVTVAGYATGLWWTQGGPSWAGIASIIADELDGRLAREGRFATEHGSALDWGADVILTPLSLMRLGRETGHETAALLAAPPVLVGQAMLRGSGWRPSVGSARAAVMLAAIILHESRAYRRRSQDR